MTGMNPNGGMMGAGQFGTNMGGMPGMGMGIPGMGMGGNMGGMFSTNMGMNNNPSMMMGGAGMGGGYPN